MVFLSERIDCSHGRWYDWKIQKKDLQRREDAGHGKKDTTEKSFSNGVSPYDSYFCGILVSWVDLWDLYACIRVQLLVSDVDELDYFRGIGGVCHGEFAAGGV